jgi:hypothetical protein
VFIHQVKISEPATNQCRINYYENFGPMEFIDLNQVKCVVRRIKDHNKWSIVDQSKLLAHEDTEYN